MNPVTEKIHYDFRTALNLSTVQVPELIESKDVDAAVALENLGFSSAKEVQQHKTIREQNRATAEQRQVVSYLRDIEAHFPQYRIISLSKVMGLMKKYGLNFGSVAHYTEKVPQVNIEEMNQYKKDLRKDSSYNGEYFAERSWLHAAFNIGATAFFIVAPKRFFLSSLTDVNGFMLPLEKPKLSISGTLERMEASIRARQTDPIVLRQLHVPSDNEVFFHIVTAWDVEADDPLVSKLVRVDSNNN